MVTRAMVEVLGIGAVVSMIACVLCVVAGAIEAVCKKFGEIDYD